ncbi:hypothetical protein [Streptomyces sp. GS7]|uniref:hypothetical protein n=1 Tax=Streptomyces sp. GS7 TaxID=2692234 RepID=UPI001318E708|nr:hypothetical protein [Streptomyces sp. GS7]QHC21020.1 hypothetical protein GR130_05815 [Streptomyces sp. GS7]
MDNTEMTDEFAAEPDPTQELAWLHERLTPSTDVRQHVVTEVVPEGFPAYVRVFHSWWLEEVPGLRRTWQEMAEAAGARYHGELTDGPLGQEVLNPPIGEQWETTGAEADADTRQGLVEILSDATAPGQAVFFSYELARSLQDEEPIVWKSSLTGLEAVRAHTGEDYGGPEHWWPEDRTWVVACDWDLTSTYVACSEELAERLVRSDRVEALRVAPTARIDGT